MKLYFFGGANEVGASSTLIEIDEKRILVDAGIRMNVEPDKKFPDFEALRQAGPPDVVLLTHAHTDHTGALPELQKWLAPEVPVYCTAPTKDITGVLLNDVVKRSKPDEKDCIKVRVANALRRMECVGFNERKEVCNGIHATWIPSGHILGAAMIYIEGQPEKILITGDVSVANQLTIPGMSLPPLQPDVMVMESTYGNRLHVDIHAERERLVSDVARTIEGGGKALLPVFAVGRSQEVILILKKAMERGEIECPVYVDGMVRDINRVYANHGEFLLPSLKRQLERGENIFCSDKIREVSRHSAREERENILSGDPCCIVASSGMLNGGMSSWYAERLAKDRANLIGLTGYQAEGNLGCALEKLIGEKDLAKRFVHLPADEEKDSVQKDADASSPVPMQVLCKVRKYSLSAHADKDELTGLAEHAQPRNLFLVHGDKEARDELSQAVKERCPSADVKLPRNGKSYTVKHLSGLEHPRGDTHDRILTKLRDYVLEKGWDGAIHIRELAEICFSSKAMATQRLALLRWILTMPEGKRLFKEIEKGTIYKVRI